ncbi:hypothetical protein [Streptomyces sp. NA02536]|uniref:hypothetical protein n=1 Tax=Streptomyces sp. NA02536 TaxID=2742133 RepID=UPI0015902A62|nr:hypothetical protein [Streptomyces sp. NA02536]QKW02863.1 hypothetical protein HUT14_24820 [Streptomyces sp. NA02536]
MLVEDLSNGERTVALYASDLPDGYRYKRGDTAQLVAWIIQGANRLGLDRLRHIAALEGGYRRFVARDMATAEQERAHAERFPDPERDRRAGELAALVTYFVSMSDEARERGLRFLLDGPCPECGDTRQVWACWAVDVDADWYEEGYGPCSLCGGAA